MVIKDLLQQGRSQTLSNTPGNLYQTKSICLSWDEMIDIMQGTQFFGIVERIFSTSWLKSYEKIFSIIRWILLNVGTMPKILCYLIKVLMLLSNVRFSASFRRLEESTHYSNTTRNDKNIFSYHHNLTNEKWMQTVKHT